MSITKVSEKELNKNKSKNRKKKKAKEKREEKVDFKMDTLIKSLSVNRYFYFVLVVSLFLYSRKKNKSFIFSLITFIITTFIGYLTHIFSHKVNMNSIYKKLESKTYFTTNKYTKKILKKTCDFIDFHDKIHHDTTINKKPINILYEIINNFLVQGGLIYGFYILSRYIEPEMFLLWAFMYTTIHHINYAIIESEEHKKHHENKFTNYGLDIWDVLCNTKPTVKSSNPITCEIEDFNHIIFNLIIGLAILYFIF